MQSLTVQDGGKVRTILAQAQWVKNNPGKKIIGTRAAVMHGNAYKTSGGLTQNHLMYNPKTGKIVSKRKRALGMKAFANMTSETKKMFEHQQQRVRLKAQMRKNAKNEAETLSQN